MHGDAGPLLGVGEGERLLGSEAAAGLVDDKHQASVRCPHLARGARWHGEERSQGDCRGVEVGVRRGGGEGGGGGRGKGEGEGEMLVMATPVIPLFI